MSTSNWVFSFLQIADGMNVTHIDTVVCDAALLANYINTTDAATLEGLSETLCELSDPEVIDLVSTIQSELDAKAILLEFEDEANECAVTKACPMEIPMDTIIKDWQVISDYFVEVLGTDEATMLSLRHSTFIVPEVCCMKQACRSHYRMHENIHRSSSTEGIILIQWKRRCATLFCCPSTSFYHSTRPIPTSRSSI